MKKLLLFAITFLMISCGTSKKVSVLNYSTPISKDVPVEIFGTGQQIPSDCQLLGTIKIGDSGLSTKCSYAEVIADAQSQARAMGGNLIYISKHSEPDFWSTCHRITAEVYKKSK